MNASRNWLRQALLGSAAVGVMMTGTAQADELSSLKAQLEALQSRVNELEATGSAAPSVPAGTRFVTFRKGALDGFEMSAPWARNGDMDPDDRGYTIAITPTADMPAPVMEVTVSGYVKGDAIYDTHADVGDSFGNTALFGGASFAGSLPLDSVEDQDHFRMHAKQTRFRIRSRSDTAVGQIRTLIEGDFEGGADNQIASNSSHFRLRHAWGEWDMTPNTTLGVGQFWSNYGHRVWYPGTVDFFGPVGAPFIRQGQVRLTHRSGPTTIAVAAENPETWAFGFTPAPAGGLTTQAESLGGTGVSDEAPDLTAHLGWSGPNNIEISLDGVVRFHSIDTSPLAPGVPGSAADDTETGFGIGAAARVPLGSMFTVWGQVHYSDGAGRYILNGVPGVQFTAAGTFASAATATGLQTIESLSVVAGASAKLSPTSTVNALFGYTDIDNEFRMGGALVDDLWSLHVNYMWQPVSKMRFGWEAIYGEQQKVGGGICGVCNGAEASNLRLQFGAWFFF